MQKKNHYFYHDFKCLLGGIFKRNLILSFESQILAVHFATKINLHCEVKCIK